MRIKLLYVLPLLWLFTPALSQKKDTINYEYINNLTLKGEVKDVLTILDTLELHRQNDIVFKKQFEDRFRYKNDRTDYLKDVPKTTAQPVQIVPRILANVSFG